jgi:hypothetical protein
MGASNPRPVIATNREQLFLLSRPYSLLISSPKKGCTGIKSSIKFAIPSSFAAMLIITPLT